MWLSCIFWVSFSWCWGIFVSMLCATDPWFVTTAQSVTSEGFLVPNKVREPRNYKGNLGNWNHFSFMWRLVWWGVCNYFGLRGEPTVFSHVLWRRLPKMGEAKPSCTLFCSNLAHVVLGILSRHCVLVLCAAGKCLLDLVYVLVANR